MSHLVGLEDRPNLRAHVTRALRAAVTTGELEAGRVYSAPTLAARLGVSATPVREAMLDLVRDGLVVAVRNKGYRVVEVTERDLDEITGLRLLLEPAAVAAAVRGMPDGEHDVLAELAAATVEAATAGALDTYLDADRVFHLRMIEHCGNRQLVNLVADLRSRTRLYGMRAIAEQHDLASTATEHVELVELARARDASAAEDLMRRHLTNVRGRWAASTSG